MATKEDEYSTDLRHKLFELNICCATEILRKTVERKLQNENISLKLYLDNIKHEVEEALNNGYVFHSQYEFMYKEIPPNLLKFDVTILTKILLDFKGLNATYDEIRHIRGLRRARNKLSHLTTEATIIQKEFEQSREHILLLAKGCGTQFYKSMCQTITTLEEKKFLPVRRLQEALKMKHECIAVDLRESVKDMTHKDTQRLKLNLLRWSKHFAIEVNITGIVEDLIERTILSIDDKQIITEEYNKENQSYVLIEMMCEANEEHFLTFLKTIRKFHSKLADLIEDSTSFGTETDERLKSIERASIQKAVRQLFSGNPSSEIESEEIHTAVVDVLQRDACYQTIEECLTEVFTLHSTSTVGCKVKGIKWKNLKELKPGKESLRNAKESPHATNESTDMTVEDLAEFIWERFHSLSENVRSQVKKAVLEEQITPRALTELTISDIEDTFKTYLDGKFGIGLRMEFESLQGEVRKLTKRRDTGMSNSSNLQRLRKFDCTLENLTYRRDNVMKHHGDLLHPVHEFRRLPKHRTMDFIVKESVSVISACMNSLQNGSIHFGVKDIGADRGFIQGLVGKQTVSWTENIDRELVVGVKRCFDVSQTDLVLQSIRRACLIPIEDSDYFVIEIDVIPLSGNTTGEPFFIHFPPNGKQTNKCFAFDKQGRLQSNVEKDRFADRYRRRVEDRRILEYKAKKKLDSKYVDSDRKTRERLEHLITGGSKNIIEDIVPLVCLGSGLPHGSQSIEGKQFLENTLQSAKVVFDFGRSPYIRHTIEKNRVYRKIVLAVKEDHPCPDIRKGPIWVYLNGDEEQGIPCLEGAHWRRDRFKAMADFVLGLKHQLPKKRSLLLFLVFKEDLPLLKFIEHCVENPFKDDRCIVISNAHNNVRKIEEAFLAFKKENEVAKLIHAGLDWLTISDILELIFKGTTSRYYKLPSSYSSHVSMYPKERVTFDQIEVISGEEIDFFIEDMDQSQLRQKKIEEQKSFYRGNEVSWWNFYFRNQVCERTFYKEQEREARHLLEDDDNPDVVQVMHVGYEAGSGGTTAGRFILWKLSQFSENRFHKSYRCCMPKLINETAIAQISDFIFFKDKKPRPAVILVDSVSDSDVKHLVNQLNSLAYKTSEANKLFCLLIVVATVNHLQNTKHLTQRLNEEEKFFFDEKFRELQGDPEFEINTLIAFNVLRLDFGQQRISYLKTLVERHVSQVTDAELGILKILTLINKFDKKRSVPRYIFDDYCNTTQEWPMSSLLGKGPKGIDSFLNTQKSDMWCLNHTTEAFNLLVVPTTTISGIPSIRILSQMLASALLDQIIKDGNTSWYAVIDFALDKMQKHKGQTDYASEEFVNLICSLFKTRQVQSDNGDIKTKFSGMIMELRGLKTEGNGEDKITGLMRRCKDITEDEMVGQQLARYYIDIHDFEKAEETIKQCLETKPKNPYLLDTYGQIFKCKLQTMLSNRFEILKDETNRIDVVNVAFKAIEKFTEGQLLQNKSTFSRSEKDFNISYSYEWEVFTALFLMERYKQFLNDTFIDNFIAYLNHGEVKDPCPFDEIGEECGLQRLKKGSPEQTHLENTLRLLEERQYQLKFKYGTIIHETGEKLLLKFRERFERFYGNPDKTNQYIFTHGVGLKSLMKAQLEEDKKKTLQQAYEKIDDRLEKRYNRGELNDGNRRDLLIYLGMNIIRLSSEGERISDSNFKKLLTLSKRLSDIEEPMDRPYIEAYLYTAMLNWPSEQRLRSRIELSTPTEYETTLKCWKHAFKRNFQNERKTPKVYFALGKGTIGEDIVDLEVIRLQWRKNKENTENRTRREVYQDRVWNEPFVKQRLQRLTGTMDDTGTIITYQIETGTSYGRFLKYKIKIRSFYKEEELSNRPVSFFLAFSWESPRAMDVKENIPVAADVKLRPHSKWPLESAGMDKAIQPLKANVPVAANVELRPHSKWHSEPAGMDKAIQPLKADVPVAANVELRPHSKWHSEPAGMDKAIQPTKANVPVAANVELRPHSKWHSEPAVPVAANVELRPHSKWHSEPAGMDKAIQPTKANDTPAIVDNEKQRKDKGTSSRRDVDPMKVTPALSWNITRTKSVSMQSANVDEQNAAVTTSPSEIKLASGLNARTEIDACDFEGDSTTIGDAGVTPAVVRCEMKVKHEKHKPRKSKKKGKRDFFNEIRDTRNNPPIEDPSDTIALSQNPTDSAGDNSESCHIEPSVSIGIAFRRKRHTAKALVDMNRDSPSEQPSEAMLKSVGAKPKSYARALNLEEATKNTESETTPISSARTEKEGTRTTVLPGRPQRPVPLKKKQQKR